MLKRNNRELVCQKIIYLCKSDFIFNIKPAFTKKNNEIFICFIIVCILLIHFL